MQQKPKPTRRDPELVTTTSSRSYPASTLRGPGKRLPSLSRCGIRPPKDPRKNTQPWAPDEAGNRSMARSHKADQSNQVDPTEWANDDEMTACIQVPAAVGLIG
jgi:hypothetical protein